MSDFNFSTIPYRFTWEREIMGADGGASYCGLGEPQHMQHFEEWRSISQLVFKVDGNRCAEMHAKRDMLKSIKHRIDEACVSGRIGPGRMAGWTQFMERGMSPWATAGLIILNNSSKLYRSDPRGIDSVGYRMEIKCALGFTHDGGAWEYWTPGDRPKSWIQVNV